jgi:uncharacterized protein YndB with AHSA1/START domain
MTAATIEREIRIDAPIEVVWDVVTNPKHIVNWFAEEATVDLRPGGAGSLNFTEHNHVSPLRVETVDPPNSIRTGGVSPTARSRPRRTPCWSSSS